MAIGIGFIIMDRLLRRIEWMSLKSKLLVQIALVVLPPLAVYAKFYLIDPRAEVIIAPKGFEGPYAIIYSIPNYPPVERKNRDLVIRLPQNGVFITSSEPPGSILLETYIEDKTTNSQYGKRIIPPIGGSGSAESLECGKRYRFSYGYISDKLEHELSFDRESFTSRLSDSLCTNGILIKN